MRALLVRLPMLRLSFALNFRLCNTTNSPSTPPSIFHRLIGLGSLNSRLTGTPWTVSRAHRAPSSTYLRAILFSQAFDTFQGRPGQFPADQDPKPLLLSREIGDKTSN